MAEDLPAPHLKRATSVMAVRAPSWFRYGVVAAATMILCSCRAAVPLCSSLAEVALTTDAQRGSTSRSTTALVSDDVSSTTPHSPANATVPATVLPTIYIQDTHTPPPAARQAEYQARLRSASYELPGSLSCGCTSHAPVVGPRDEYLCDGGDDGLAAAVRKDWQVDGLEEEDTVAHYDTVDGRTVVAPSNRVCIYAPRFGVVRRSIDLHEYASYAMLVGFNDSLNLAKIEESEEAATSLSGLEPSIHRAEAPPSLLRERQQVGELDREQRVAEFDGSLSVYANLQVIRTGTVSNDEKALLARASLAAITWTGDQAPQITIDRRHAQAAVSQRQAGVVYHQEDPTKPRLRLIKLASRGSARPGEEIEFTLRFDNIGSQVMGNVTIVDHLPTRLEYVADSAKASVESDFSSHPKSGGSSVLRWEIKEPIEAGEGGVLQFKCKVL